MKTIINIFLLLGIIAFASCSKDVISEKENQQQASINEFKFSEEVVVFNETADKSIIVKVSSNNIDSLNTYIEATEFHLILEGEKLENYKPKAEQSNDTKTLIEREPSVEVEVLFTNGNTNFGVLYTKRELKSGIWYSVPYAAYTSTTGFLGFYNYGSLAGGVRYSVKQNWWNGWNDVTDPPSINIIESSEKNYFSDDVYKIRGSLYATYLGNPSLLALYYEGSYNQY